MNHTNRKFVVVMVGALLAYTVGASFGTGQEFWQFYAVHGLLGIAGVVVQATCLAIFSLLIVNQCRDQNVATPRQCLELYCGKILGSALYGYTVVYLFFILVALISGAGGVISEYLNVPAAFGSVAMTGASLCAVSLGVSRVLRLISFIAPLKIAMVVVISLLALVAPQDGLTVGNGIASHSENMKIANNWLISALLHCSYAILFFVPFLLQLLNERGSDRRSTTYTICIGFSILMAVSLLMVIAMVSNFSALIGTQAPNLKLASLYAPSLANIFAVVLVAAIFTTLTPLASMVIQELSRKFDGYRLAVSLAVLVSATLISLAGSYSQILNVLITISSWVGTVIIVAVILYTFRCYKKSSTLISEK
jgi:uncharacterized membrane protein YkvI